MLFWESIFASFSIFSPSLQNSTRNSNKYCTQVIQQRERMLQKLTPAFFASKHSPFEIPQFCIIRPCTADSVLHLEEVMPNIMHPDGSTMQPSDISAPIFHFFHPPCTSHATCPRTTASYRKIQQTHAAQIVQTHAELFFFLNSSSRRENNKCMVVM